MNDKIPKIIHYCWFGGNPKSKLIKKCIRSWKKYCPEYEIKEWNEDNFDINICEYTKEAYNLKKWAFVSDYARFYILNKYGGVYLDTDVQLLRPIDELLNAGKFMGFGREDIVNTGLIMATKANDWLCEEILSSYRGEIFSWDNPSEILAIGRRVTSILVNYGLRLDGSMQHIRDYTIYPKYYFNPTDGDMFSRIDKRAYSIHHYAATWFPKKERIKNTIRRCLGQKRLKPYYKAKHFLSKKLKR